MRKTTSQDIMNANRRDHMHRQLSCLTDACPNKVHQLHASSVDRRSVSVRANVLGNFISKQLVQGLLLTPSGRRDTSETLFLPTGGIWLEPFEIIFIKGC